MFRYFVSFLCLRFCSQADCGLTGCAVRLCRRFAAAPCGRPSPKHVSWPLQNRSTPPTGGGGGACGRTLLLRITQCSRFYCPEPFPVSDSDGRRPVPALRTHPSVSGGSADDLHAPELALRRSRTGDCLPHSCRPSPVGPSPCPVGCRGSSVGRLRCAMPCAVLPDDSIFAPPRLPFFVLSVVPSIGYENFFAGPETAR